MSRRRGSVVIDGVGESWCVAWTPLAFELLWEMFRVAKVKYMTPDVP